MTRVADSPINGPGTQVLRSGESRAIPSLDGLRAISIALVMLAHAAGTRGFPVWIPGFVTEHGFLGVQIFFVISGFLITRLLLDEHATTGAISLGLFYARRTLRIFPPFYLFLGVVAAGTWAGIFSVPRRDLVFAATYTMNYLTRGGVWLTGHTWSLAVEEQFYLIWPLAIKLVGARRATWSAAIVAAASPLFCLAVYLFNADIGGRLIKYFPFVADSIAAGCVLAACLPWVRRHHKALRLAHPLGEFVIPVLLILDLGRNHPVISLGVTETALNLCICYCIARYTAYPTGFVGKLLNHRYVTFVGKLSYSWYLWQQMFVNRFERNIVTSFPINIGAAFGCAAISWYSVELPLAGLRKRLRATRVQESVPAFGGAVPEVGHPRQ